MSLAIIPTPIGNLEDMTFRAVRMLKEADLILAEDTRTSGILLKHYEISTQMVSYHAHNEHRTVDNWIEKMQQGMNLALITDAGTPGISDPGFLIVRACQQNDISVTCLPGATALIPAIVASGFPSDRFHFEGFLPHKKGRQTRLQFCKQYPYSVILYESPHRLGRTIKQLIDTYGENQKIAVARELSKKFEEIITGELSFFINKLNDGWKPKGEIVLVIAPPEA